MLQDVLQEPPPPRLRSLNNLNRLPTIFDAGEAELHRRFFAFMRAAKGVFTACALNMHAKKTHA